MLDNHHILFPFVWPRVPEEILQEVRLLAEELAGQNWNSERVQHQLFFWLCDADFYRDELEPFAGFHALKPTLALASQSLGFVDLKPEIALTEAGQRLLSGVRTHETFTRQLMKFQLPSPNHTADTQGRFCVKPYLELLRLTSDLGAISKTEVALFFLQLTHWNKYDEVKQKIVDFRAAAKANQGNRKVFVAARFKSEIEAVYADKIGQGETGTRENSDDSVSSYVSTKGSNWRDYGDAFIRYLRATGLVTFDARANRLSISKFRKDEVDFLLKNVPRQPTTFASTANFKTFLFTPDNLVLLTDDAKRLAKHIKGVEARVPTSAHRDNVPSEVEPMKDYLSELEAVLQKLNLAATQKQLKTYKDWPDIVDMFEKIKSKSKELIDHPLYLEWNVWRSLTMLNYGAIDANLRFDLDGEPLSTAGGGQPDIQCEYDDFRLIVEVTLSSGQKQHDMEGEPVSRHFATIKAKGTTPLFCLFVAPKISEGTLTHFYQINQIKTKLHSGKPQIIPMTLNTFIAFSKQGVEKKFNDPQKMKAFCQKAIDLLSTVADEGVWLDEIQQSATQWV